MLFDSIQYWVFFALVLVLASRLSFSNAKIALVVASYVFYAFWDVRFLLLLGGSTLANYVFGLKIDAGGGKSRKSVLVLAVVSNLCLLAVFKYYNFFIGSLAPMLGVSEINLTLNIVLPVGISFFTFEGIAYVADVYRRDLKAVRNPVDFALFISFFPHLVAGPIIRPAHFFPQTENVAPLSASDLNWGLVQILKGLVKKMVFADFFGPIADASFNGTPYQGMVVASPFGLLAFSLQIYFDFAGYTDIARGCARLLGFRFPPNFDRPYLSVNIVEFWKSWHISLSTWLRDYLYIPLGGNRSGAFRTYINLVIVMGLGGLWHGASWNFLIWGLVHGGLLVAHRHWRNGLRFANLEALADHPGAAPVWTALTFILVSLAWIPFRAHDVATSLRMLSGLSSVPAADFLIKVPGFSALICLSCLVCLVDRRRVVQDWLVKRESAWVMGGATGVALWFIGVFGQLDSGVPFIYFQF